MLREHLRIFEKKFLSATKAAVQAKNIPNFGDLACQTRGANGREILSTQFFTSKHPNSVAPIFKWAFSCHCTLALADTSQRLELHLLVNSLLHLHFPSALALVASKTPMAPLYTAPLPTYLFTVEQSNKMPPEEDTIAMCHTSGTTMTSSPMIVPSPTNDSLSSLRAVSEGEISGIGNSEDATLSASNVMNANLFHEDSSDIAEVVLSLFHNAQSREITYYRSLSRPMLTGTVAEDDVKHYFTYIAQRWGELKRFLILVSEVENLVCSSVLWTVDATTQNPNHLKRAYNRICLRNNIGLDIHLRIIDRNCKRIADPSMQELRNFVVSTQKLITIVETTGRECWSFFHRAEETGNRSAYLSFEARLWDAVHSNLQKQNFGDTAARLIFWRDEPYQYMSQFRRPNKETIMIKIRRWMREYVARHEKDDDSTSSSSSNTESCSSSNEIQ